MQASAVKNVINIILPEQASGRQKCFTGNTTTALPPCLFSAAASSDLLRQPLPRRLQAAAVWS